MRQKGKIFTLILILAFAILAGGLFWVLRISAVGRFAIGLYSAHAISKDGVFLSPVSRKNFGATMLAAPILPTVSIQMPFWARIEKGTAGQTKMHALAILLSNKGCSIGKPIWLRTVLYGRKVYEEETFGQQNNLIPGQSLWLVVIRLAVSELDKQQIQQNFPSFHQCSSVQQSLEKLRVWSLQNGGNGDLVSKEALLVP